MPRQDEPASRQENLLERFLLGLCMALLAGVTTWHWTMRQELSDTQRIVYERKDSVEQIPLMHKELQRLDAEQVSRKQMLDRIPILQDGMQALAVEQAVLRRDSMLLREMVVDRLTRYDRQLASLTVRLKDHRSPERLYNEEGP